MTDLLTKLSNIYENISKYTPQNRIDGIFVGDARELLAKILHIIHDGCKIFIIGEIKNNNLFYNRQGRYCLTIKDNKKTIIDLL